MEEKNKNPWTLLRKEEVYDNPWINVEHHEVLKPNGAEGIYGIVHFKNVATGVIPMDEQHHIYLVGQYRYSIKEYSWEIPEGGGSHDELPVEAAKRELLEEVGLTARDWKPLLTMNMSNSVTDEYCEVFLATNLTKGKADPEDTEVLKVKKVSFEKAVEMVLSGEIKDAISMAAILKLKVLYPDLGKNKNTYV